MVCGDAGLPVPSLLVEPGRALVATAGVVLYRVAVVKHQQRRTFVVVDGGMGDNPRPALYGSRYAPRLVGRSAAGTGRTVTVVGRYCESGDVLAEDVTLPADLVAGDLLAFPAAGAYQASMSSTYNAVPRPPVVALRAGRARVLVRRETVEDLGPSRRGALNVGPSARVHPRTLRRVGDGAADDLAGHRCDLPDAEEQEPHDVGQRVPL